MFFLVYLCSISLICSAGVRKILIYTSVSNLALLLLTLAHWLTFKYHVSCHLDMLASSFLLANPVLCPFHSKGFRVGVNRRCPWECVGADYCRCENAAAHGAARRRSGRSGSVAADQAVRGERRGPQPRRAGYLGCKCRWGGTCRRTWYSLQKGPFGRESW